MKSPTCTLELISVKRAAIWLQSTETVGFTNRNITASIVSRYMGDMARSDWFIHTGETIKIAKHKKNGLEYVIDGQHRLKAIMLGKKPVKLWIFRYIPEEAFQFIDQGKPRELKDIMTINNSGWASNSGVFSSAGRMLWKEDKTGDAARKPSGTDMESEGNIAEYLFTNYPTLPKVFTEIETPLKSIQAGGLGGKAWLLFLMFRWNVVDADLADQVIDYLRVKGARQAAFKLLHRNPSSSKGQEMLKEFPEVKPPTNIWELAVNYVTEARREHEEIDSQGRRRILKGRNQDLLTATMRAYMVAWNSTRAGQKRLTKAGFESAIASYVEKKGNTIGNAG